MSRLNFRSRNCLLALAGAGMLMLGTSSRASAAAISPDISVLTIPTSAITAAATPAQDKAADKKRYPWIGPEIGVFLPSGGKVQDRFGSTWTSVSLGFGHISQKNDRNAFGIDYRAIFNKSGDNHVFLAPVGAAYQQFLGKSEKANPYVGASANLVFVDVKSVPDNVKSGLNIVPGGSIFAGVAFSRTAYVEARYTAVAEVKGFDLSGTNLVLGLRF